MTCLSLSTPLRPLRRTLSEFLCNSQIMSQFHYSAIDGAGKQILGQLTANTRGDELQALARHVTYVTRLQLENVFEASASTVRIDGLAESAEEVLKMNARILNNSDRYDLRPQGIEPAPAGSVFPAQFRIETVLRETRSLQSETP